MLEMHSEGLNEGGGGGEGPLVGCPLKFSYFVRGPLKFSIFVARLSVNLS